MKCVHRSTQSRSPKYLSERNRCQPDAKKKIICQKLIAVSLLLLQVTEDNQNENKGTQIESCKSPQTTRATAQSNLCYQILLQAP